MGRGWLGRGSWFVVRVCLKIKRPPYRVGMLKYDWLKIAEIHVFAKSLAVAVFVMADTLVSWTFLDQNCC